MLWKPAGLPPSVRSLRTALRASFRTEGVKITCHPMELSRKEWEVVVVVAMATVNGSVVEEELVYPLKESEVKEHQADIMQLVGAWLHHIFSVTEDDFAE